MNFSKNNFDGFELNRNRTSKDKKERSSGDERMGMKDVAFGVACFLGGYVLSLLVNTSEIKNKKSKKVKNIQKNMLDISRREIKLVMVCNNALKMGKGKLCAQCAHAAVGILQTASHGDEYRLWMQYGQPKICLKCEDDTEMDLLQKKASAAGVDSFMVQDAGRTQVPSGSKTVLAIGPADNEILDTITGHLKLL